MSDLRPEFKKDVGDLIRTSGWKVTLPTIEDKGLPHFRVQTLDLGMGNLVTLPLQLNFKALNYAVGMDYSEGISLQVLEDKKGKSHEFFKLWRSLAIADDGTLGEVSKYKQDIVVDLGSFSGGTFTSYNTLRYTVKGCFPTSVGKYTLVRSDATLVMYDVQFMIDGVE